jgi:hypothetical protein
MDIYARAVSYLNSHPTQIHEVWDDPKSHWSGVLFQAATPTGCHDVNPSGRNCGDLCAIRSLEAQAWTPKLTDLIANDRRIPKIDDQNNAPKIDANKLNVFAEWQRALDMELRRDPLDYLKEIGVEAPV